MDNNSSHFNLGGKLCTCTIKHKKGIIIVFLDLIALISSTCKKT